MSMNQIQLKINNHILLHDAEKRTSKTRQTTQQRGCIPLHPPKEVAINTEPHWIQATLHLEHM